MVPRPSIATATSCSEKTISAFRYVRVLGKQRPALVGNDDGWQVRTRTGNRDETKTRLDRRPGFSAISRGPPGARLLIKLEYCARVVFREVKRGTHLAIRQPDQRKRNATRGWVNGCTLPGRATVVGIENDAIVFPVPAIGVSDRDKAAVVGAIQLANNNPALAVSQFRLGCRRNVDASPRLNIASSRPSPETRARCHDQPFVILFAFIVRSPKFQRSNADFSQHPMARRPKSEMPLRRGRCPVSFLHPELICGVDDFSGQLTAALIGGLGHQLRA